MAHQSHQREQEFLVALIKEQTKSLDHLMETLDHLTETLGLLARIMVQVMEQVRQGDLRDWPS